MNSAITVVLTALLLADGSNPPPPEVGAGSNGSATSRVRLVVPDDEQPTADRPAITLHKDGFPTGNDTAEGAASDLMRAFIGRDAELFQQRRWVAFCEGTADPSLAYKRFLTHTPAVITPKASKDRPALPSSQRIGSVFAARRSTDTSEQAAALVKLLGDMGHEAFVDVVTIGEDGTQYLSRVSVSQRIDKKWYAGFTSRHDKEPPSTTEFADVYTLPEQQAQ
jgi:hypothetical protein